MPARTVRRLRSVTDAPGKFAPNAEVYAAAYYERMYRPHWFLRNRRKYDERDAALLRIVVPSPASRVLEVGSARGDTAFFLAPRVAAVVGLDAAPAAVAAARAEQASRGLANVRFEEGDARDLSRVPGGPFDVVLLADFVEHVLDDVLVPCLESARQVLAPGGALAIYTPNASHWAERIKATVPGLQQEDHIAVRPAERVVALATAAGFRVEDLFFSASPYPVLGAFDRALPMVGLCRFRTCLRAVTSPA
jgi:SAM-dependent methyltransferase